MAAVTICSDFGAQKNKVWHCFHCFPIYLPWSDGTGCHEVMGLDAMILVFWMFSFKPTFSLSSFTFIKRLFSSSLLSAIRVIVICISEVIDIVSKIYLLCYFSPRFLAVFNFLYSQINNSKTFSASKINYIHFYLNMLQLKLI